MAVVNGPQFPALSLGKSVKIGTVTTATDGLQFSFIPRSGDHLGHIVVQVIPNGTVTAFTADIRLSLDGGTTFNAQVAAGGSTLASNTAALNFQTNPLQSVALPGSGGQMSFLFQTVSLTLGTATKIDIWGIES